MWLTDPCGVVLVGVLGRSFGFGHLGGVRASSRYHTLGAGSNHGLHQPGPHVSQLLMLQHLVSEQS